MYKYRHTLPVIIGFLIVWSCQAPIQAPPSIMAVIDKAGSNRAALEEVIRHYSKDPVDRPKRKAALFLIAHMPGLVSLDTASITQNDIYFNSIGNLWNKVNRKPEGYEISKLIDSINAAQNLSPRGLPAKYAADLETVSAELLIDNIDRAFEEWNREPYAKNVSFKDFCNYILPYRCSDTYSPGMKAYFREKYKHTLHHIKNAQDPWEVADSILEDTYSNFREDFLTFRKYPYLLPVKFSTLLHAKIGECHDVNTLRVNILRSFGIPSAVDGMPGWGNSNSKHFWYTIIDRSRRRELVTNEQVIVKGRNRLGVYHGSYDIDIRKGDLPQNVDVYYSKFIAKVFREEFCKQPGSLAADNAGHEPLPDYFKSDRLLDVTQEYVKCSNIDVPLANDPQKNHTYAYLCTYDNTGMSIVDWSRVSGPSVHFKNVGLNIVYLPAWYENGEIIPAGNPFLLTREGAVKPFLPDTTVKEKQTYVLKYPYHPNMVYFARCAEGARFQGANQPDFSDSVPLHTIDKFPFYGTDIKIRPKNKYRYLIFQFAGLPNAQIAEIEYWGLNKEGKEVKLTGTLTGNKGAGDTHTGNAFDSDVLSYFIAKKNDYSWIAMDLGAENAGVVTRIKYMPRNDDNVISASKKYTLYYWNNGWCSLGERTPVADKQVIFDNVPRNALLLLKDNNGGEENRIFTYENGKQIFR